MDGVTIFTALGAGIASFLSPCVLPLVPVYLASLAGPQILEPGGYDRTKLFGHSLLFVAGFGTVFTVSGALVGLAGIVIGPGSWLVRLISGTALVVLGSIMLLALKIPVLNFEARLTPRLGATTGYLRSFIIGASFALAWTPCLGPVLGGILMLAFNSSTAWEGAGLLAVYSLGLGLPFLALGLAFSTFIPWLKKIKRYSRLIYVISGVILIIIGVLILTGNLDWLYL